MDRRRFVKRAGLAVAGSAFGSSFFGCSSIVVEIPCLGPAAAPVPVPGMTYIRASQLGCALDCNLATGKNKHTGGSATDDAPLINAAMAGASASNPMTLIIDGSSLISGLFLPAGGYWSIAGLGCGTGFFIKKGTNNDGIHNGGTDTTAFENPGPPAPARGSNVSLSNFTMNGNQGNGSNGDSTSGVRQGDKSGNWYFGINLMNLDHITVQNVVVVNAPSFHFRFSNVGNVAVSGCVMKSIGLSTDGLHFDGPANDITISDCQFFTGDDGIALNCPEGWTGNISRVSVSNCSFNSWSLMRLDSIQCSGCSSKFNIDTVSVSNCSGTLVEAGFLLGMGAQSNPNAITGLTVSNCTLKAPAILELGSNFGAVTLSNVTLIPSFSSLSSQFAPPGSAIARTSPFFYGCTYVGSNLTLNNCVIQREYDLPVAAIFLEYGSMISDFTFNGFAVRDPGGSSYKSVPALIEIGSGSIEQLVLNALNSQHITVAAKADGFSNIGSVSGTGVLATGWEFPDAVMANGVPYLSATTGSPSIIINGVVEPYPSG